METEYVLRSILFELHVLRITFNSRVEAVCLDNIRLTPGPGEPELDVFRFLNISTGTHFYAPSEAERDIVNDTLPDFVDEGIAFYVDLLVG